MSLGIKQVIQLARAQFNELLPDLSIETSDVRLEEIEKENENWAVTFSVPNPSYNPEAFLAGIRSARMAARIAKIVVVDGNEGQLVALRERAA